MSVAPDDVPILSPPRDGAKRTLLTLAGGQVVALVADDAAKRRAGWAEATGAEALFFSFDVEALHGFWMRGIERDLDLAFLAGDGTVLAVERMSAGSDALEYPPEPIRYALQLPADEAAARGVVVGAHVGFSPEEVAPELPVYLPEPPLTPDASDDAALVERWAAREHMYSSRPFAAASMHMGRGLRVGPHDVAILVEDGAGFVVHPKLTPLGALGSLAKSLGLAWIRLELSPVARLLLPDGRVVVERFNPRVPDEWLARMRAHGLLPTTTRWQFTRTLVVDLSGDAATVLARLPTRIRYEARTFDKAVAAGRYRVDVVPRAAFDARQERAIADLHGRWLGGHDEAEDNMRFCRPMAHAFQDALTAYLCWRDNDLLAMQLHVLWDRTLYFLFSEAVGDSPQGLTPGLLWHGVRHALTAPFGPSAAPDLLDLVGATDPRYPGFRPWGAGFSAAKLRWHPTSVWFPPSVAFPGTELPT